MNAARPMSEWALRLGLGLTYLYSGIELLVDPAVWEFFIPDALYQVLEKNAAVHLFLRAQGVGELALALVFLAWFLPKRAVQVAALAVALEMALILMLLGIDTATFRDIGLLGSAIALGFLLHPPKTNAVIMLILFLMTGIPHADAKTLSPEDKLTRRKCSSCHIPPKPGRYTEDELWSALKTHSKQLDRLSDEEKITIVNFLKKMPLDASNPPYDNNSKE